MGGVEQFPIQHKSLTKEEIKEMHDNPRFSLIETRVIGCILGTSEESIGEDDTRRMCEWIQVNGELLSEWTAWYLKYRSEWSNEQIIDAVAKEMQSSGQELSEKEHRHAA